VYFGRQAFLWPIAVKATLRGENAMLGVGWQLHQPSYAFDDVLTPVFDMVLVIFIPSHIIMSVLFALSKSLIICHISQEHLDAFTILEAWETLNGVFCLQDVVIVRLHALYVDPTLDLFVLITHCNRVVLERSARNPPAVWVRTAKIVQFCYKAVQKPDLLHLGGPIPDTDPSTQGCGRVWLDWLVPMSSSGIRVLKYIWSLSDILLLITKY
jgi:hypothetical protein